MVLAAAVSSAAVLAFAPLIHELGRAMVLASSRARASEEAMAAEDFMTEKIRNNYLPSEGDRGKSSSLSYTEGGNWGWRRYTFFEEGEKIKIELYNGQMQPLTGGGKGRDSVLVKDLSFQTEEEGLIHYSFTAMNGGQPYEMETAVWPYADFFGAL